jgi:RHS repeat-associated protein
MTSAHTYQKQRSFSPRRIEYAGANVDGANVKYAEKYLSLQQTIKDRYAKFEVPYLGKDNDDYVNGQGFCCADLPANTPMRAPAANDNPELFQYYYHSDHLGSTSLITDLDGNVVQHIEYVPFGEVFIEERNNKWNTPYLFNAKELDEETGLYYYGARYYEPRVSVWINPDPLQERHPNMSTYAYVGNNPINAIDPNGMDSIQRNDAVQRAQEYVAKNPGDSYLWGGQGQPGSGVDCSGMVRNCIQQGEEPDPFKGRNGRGVQRIMQASERVENYNNVEVGNVVVLDNSRSGNDNPTGHIGIIEKVHSDDSGNATGVTIIDSGGTRGSGKSEPRRTNIKFGGNGYWDKRVTGVYKWDTRPDNPPIIQLQEVVIYGIAPTQPKPVGVSVTPIQFKSELK